MKPTLIPHGLRQTAPPRTTTIIRALHTQPKAARRPRLLPSSSHLHQQRRTFLPNPLSTLNTLASAATTSTTSSNTATQTLRATRTLPHAPSSIYAIIADVPSYASFLPFCTSSTVTRWSAPDALTAQTWPSEAELVVGWKGIEERFTSRIYCVPGRVVEAVGGGTRTQLPVEEIRHHGEQNGSGGDARNSSVLSHLLTRWTIRLEESGTRVDLAIEYRFANPLYSAMSGAVKDRVAGYMIEAFEGRVRSLLGDGKGRGMEGTRAGETARALEKVMR